MLRFDNLTQRFDDFTLFENLRFRAERGCFALRDEGGGGKSTLLGMLAGERDAGQGNIWIDGHSMRDDAAGARASLAFVPYDCLAEPLQTGRGFLDARAAARRTSVDARVLDLVERFSLMPHMEKRFEQMSTGTRRKFYLTAVLLGGPRVILADEPTGGLDAASRAVLIDLFTTLGETGCVFFSTHDDELVDGCRATPLRFPELSGAEPA
ncbi:ABC transporter ATP-binding protein [Pandoraea pulmonicola]|uniref:ABC transporter ATP-binding protein n=1 Tax=Pandoraea pulmonicola TaxID=93221 RepID=A0AAJ5D0T0_PANPU|nr:ATP-binding cassette domain-containing protein [Pandoraea pulmonicola]AJC20535.1 ABC transporter ATP-binding protein [Pandoraea pulmonicola]SUA91028.1 Lipoprotein-releasing system ATP-binding protein LolD [Pandoraea pulmonicola]